MKIKIPIKKTVESFEEKEIDLPFYSKGFCDSYMITEDETIIKVYCGSGFTNIQVFESDQEGPWGQEDIYEEALKDVAQGTEITKEDFWNTFEKALSLIYHEMRIMPPGRAVEEKEYLADKELMDIIVNGNREFIDVPTSENAKLNQE